MEQFTKSNCRICLSNEAALYISIHDDILNTKIVDLIFEISNKKMCIDDALSALICTKCCKELRQAVKIRRLFLRNDAALLDCYNNFKTEILIEDENDPFLVDDADLEFVERLEEAEAIAIKEEVMENCKVKLETDSNLGDETDMEYSDNDEIQVPTSLSIRKVNEDSTSSHQSEGYDPENMPTQDEADEQAIAEINLDDEVDYESPVLLKGTAKPVSQPFRYKPVTTKHMGIDKAPVLTIPLEKLKYSCCMCCHICEDELELIEHLHTHPERARRSAFRKKFKEAAPDQKRQRGKDCIKCLRRIQVTHLQFHLKYYYVEQKFQCSNCGQTYGFYQQMKQHELKCIKLAKQASGVLPTEKFECQICGKFLKTKSILESHIRGHNMTDEDRVKFRCKICSKGYPSLRSLRSHVLLHTDVAIFQCTMCDKAFKKRNNLDAHIRVHNNDRIYKCSYCEKTYIHSTDKKRHEMSVHTGERPHKCEFCGEGFIKKHSLTVHCRKMHTTEPEAETMIIVYEQEN